ncbi:MAG: tRNA 4-thiouridine(8) synthase ThiI [Deltaproteobacteria bacterium]|jgi:thiamine biosynthesis protein ThiI|nr:tRNA 4-thiouridine(8) synthase ThiI [Deltaproteobacteria bacterium]
MKKIIIVKYNEIFIKKGNRRLFKNKLLNNIRKAVAEFEKVEVKNIHGRIIVHGYEAENEGEILTRLKKVFGIYSLSPSLKIEPDLAAARQAALQLVSKLKIKPDTFKVAAKRSDKSFPITSPEIAREVGAAVFHEKNIAVDLGKPQLVVEVEIGRQISFVSVDSLKADGGLPVGSSGHGEVLLSGGIDSPVAAWMMLKRGMSLSATTFYSPPWVGDESLKKVEKLCSILREWGGPDKLHVIAYGMAQKELSQLNAKLALIMYRRLMLRVAAQMAFKDGAKALVTGESLGQVASQTIENMAVIEAASPLLVLKPLTGFNKEEIITQAKKIGSFETSILPHQDSCSLFTPKHPETKAQLKYVLRYEKQVEMAAMVKELTDNAQTIEF